MSTLEPGTYLWRSPLGYQYLRDHTGTIDVTPDATDAATPASLIAHFDVGHSADPPET